MCINKQTQKIVYGMIHNSTTRKKRQREYNMNKYDYQETKCVVTRWIDKRRETEPLFRIFTRLPVEHRIKFQQEFDVWMQINDELDRLDVDLTVTQLEFDGAQSRKDYTAAISCHNDLMRLYEEQASAQIDREVIERHPVIKAIINASSNSK